jgi:hypothetical protein
MKLSFLLWKVYDKNEFFYIKGDVNCGKKRTNTNAKR